MRAILVRALCALACLLGLHHLARGFNRRRLLILVYHGVVDGPLPDDVPDWHHVDVARFRRQLEYLRRHYEVLDVDAALDRLQRDALRRPTACITFDDGYVNNRTVALPVLRALELPATIYLATGLIGTDRRLWTVELETAIRRTTLPSLDLRALGLGVRTLNRLSDRVRAARDGARVLKRYPPARRELALAALREQLAVNGTADSAVFQMMTWQDVRDLEATGLVRFGGHTVNHELLSCLDDTGQTFEIGESVRAVRAAVDRPGSTFAWPNGERGDFDERAISVLRGTGVHHALSTVAGLNDATTHPCALHRLTIGRDMDFDRFRIGCSGLLRPTPRPRLHDGG